MPSLYNPDPAAVLVDPWNNAFLTQRDVGLLVPINFHTGPVASLRAACFAHNQYQDAAFLKCVSNLLASGFRRFLVDVYWDPGRAVWSLCPVEVPPEEEEQDAETVPPVITVSTSTSGNAPGSTGTGQAPRWIRETIPTPSPLGRDIKIWVRQDASESVSELTSASSSLQITTTGVSSATSEVSGPSVTSSPAETTVPIPTFPVDENGPPLFQIGEYNCTSTITLNLLNGLLEEYLEGTDATRSAAITYVILNIHAAASLDAPDASAQKPSADQMPTPGSLIKNVMSGNLSDKLYTPHQLQNDRIDLNSSWQDVAWDNLPRSGYYRSYLGQNDRWMTQEGWPTEAYAEFKEYYRLVAGFGYIDPQMADYNVTEDHDTIFGQNETRMIHQTSFSQSSRITEGCLFSAADDTITSTGNSSWAWSLAPQLNLGLDPNVTTPVPAITNLTSCGISPFLNVTLSNTTADQNLTPYVAFAHSALWTWAPGQPPNNSDAASNDYRGKCTTISTSPPYPGRWQTSDCRSRHRLACQDPENPYHWEISTDTPTYFNSDNVCPRGFQFSVPHTGLENAHLLSALQSASSSLPSSTISDNTVFINWNSIDVNDCWTTNVNGTCPYTPRTDRDKTRVVVVPTVAAVIIFVLAALTFFVKCAANRREDKKGRRRRMVGGWEYEGVPS